MMTLVLLFMAAVSEQFLPDCSCSIAVSLWCYSFLHWRIKRRWCGDDVHSVSKNISDIFDRNL